VVDADKPLTEARSGDGLSVEPKGVEVSGWTGGCLDATASNSKIQFCGGFETVANWDEMEALVQYCYLLAWERKMPTASSNRVPIFHQAFETLVVIADKVK
jgi:hypothetical protein